MSCPHCHSNKIWDDNLHWGCENCGWSSVGMLNSTSTSSRTPAYRSPYEIEQLRIRQESARIARIQREQEQYDDE